MSIRKGVKGALPIMLGYVPVGIAFGIISADGDLPLYVVVMLCRWCLKDFTLKIEETKQQ